MQLVHPWPVCPKHTSRGFYATLFWCKKWQSDVYSPPLYSALCPSWYAYFSLSLSNGHAVTRVMIPSPNPIFLPPGQVKLFDINNRKDASDFRVLFSYSGDPEILTGFRIILVKETHVGNFDLDQANGISSERSFKVMPRAGRLGVTLPQNMLDSDGESIAENTAYGAFILSESESDITFNKLSPSSNIQSLALREVRDIYVSSSKTNSVEMFDGETGEYIRSFIPTGRGGLRNTQEIIFLSDDKVIVSGFGNSAIKLYDGSGNFVEDFTKGYRLGKPAKMTIGPDGLLYVSQWENTINNVARFDKHTGEFVDEFVKGVDRAMGHAWDASGNLYLACFGSQNVRKYDREGNLQTNIGDGQLKGPVNVWIDGADLYAVDWNTGSVRTFETATGNFSSVFISGLKNVEGFLFDDMGNLFLWRLGSGPGEQVSRKHRPIYRNFYFRKSGYTQRPCLGSQ